MKEAAKATVITRRVSLSGSADLNIPDGTQFYHFVDGFLEEPGVTPMFW